MEDSMIFTEEEIRYYQALLAWEPSDDEEDDVLEDQPYVSESPVGQFMVLVLGAKGCGKTSMLERVMLIPEGICFLIFLIEYSSVEEHLSEIIGFLISMSMSADTGTV